MSKKELASLRLVHLYAGDGKGKSTASAGLCLRARGSGWRVLFCQFLKARPSGEVPMLETTGVDTLRAPSSAKFTWDLTPEEKEQFTAAHAGFLQELKGRFDDYDLIVLDEVVDAVNGGFISFADLESLIKERPDTLEIVMTGHNPSEDVISLADYYTDFRCVKHPYQKDVPARKGIES